MIRLVIDVCIANKNFAKNFPTVKRLIVERRALLIYGGSKYLEEAKKNYRLTTILSEANSSGLSKMLDRRVVDQEAERIAGIMAQAKSCSSYCDDPHLFALFALGQPQAILTSDHRISQCHRCVRRNLGNHFGVKRPRLYLRDSQLKKALAKT